MKGSYKVDLIGVEEKERLYKQYEKRYLFTRKASILQYLLDNNFCNPHLLVTDKRKTDLRKDFFIQYLKQTRVHLISTRLAKNQRSSCQKIAYCNRG